MELASRSLTHESLNPQQEVRMHGKLASIPGHPRLRHLKLRFSSLNIVTRSVSFEVAPFTLFVPSPPSTCRDKGHSNETILTASGWGRGLGRGGGTALDSAPSPSPHTHRCNALPVNANERDGCGGEGTKTPKSATSKSVSEGVPRLRFELRVERGSETTSAISHAV